jgi:DMSO/TMAO reductase YedYZ heme-binding membrane subunit
MLVVAGLILWAALLLYTLFSVPNPLWRTILRAAALFGYTALFLTILATEYMREMRKLFGRPFLLVHHRLALLALCLIALHPLTYALSTGSLSVLVPIWSPLRDFLTWASRPALYLILIATAAGVVRNRLKSQWKFIHWLNYVAFFLVFVHSRLLGSDMASGILRLAWAVMAAIVLVVLAHKRLFSR